jgi:hypothetical protein
VEGRGGDYTALDTAVGASLRVSYRNHCRLDLAQLSSCARSGVGLKNTFVLHQTFIELIPFKDSPFSELRSENIAACVRIRPKELIN